MTVCLLIKKKKQLQYLILLQIIIGFNCRSIDSIKKTNASYIIGKLRNLLDEYYNPDGGNDYENNIQLNPTEGVSQRKNIIHNHLRFPMNIKSGKYHFTVD